MVGAGHLFQGLLPGLGLAGGEHGVEFVACGFGAVEGAAVERTCVTAGVTHCFEELELVDAGEEVAGVGDVAGDVIFGAGIEVGFGAGDGWGYALIFFAERPPGLVVVGGLDLAGEDLPAPLVDEARPKGRKAILSRAVRSCRGMSASAGGIWSMRPSCLEVGGGDGEGDGVADGLVKAVVGAVAEEEGLLVVGALIHVVAQLVVDGGEVVGVDLDAHLYAEVVDVIDVPCGGVADDFAIAGLDELGALPEGVGERSEAEGREEALAVVDHVLRGGEVGGVEGVGGGVGAVTKAGAAAGSVAAICFLRAASRSYILNCARIWIGGRDDVVDVAPLLGPHVAEEVGGNHAVGTVGSGAVFLDELVADVGVELADREARAGPRCVRARRRTRRGSCRSRSARGRRCR